MKKARFLTAVIMAACTVLTACGSGSYGSSEAAVADYSYEDSSYDDYAVTEEAYEDYDNSQESGSEKVDESAEATDRKLIRTVYLTVETYDFGELTAQIEARAEALGGYVESSNVYGGENSTSRSASYTLRIPAANADDFIETIDDKSNVTSHSENVQDVTLSYVDIQSRKESLQIEYDRLQDMLGNAETVEDMISIEDRLSDVRYEIESIESQLRVYDNQIDYTTINLDVEEVREYTEPEPVDDSVGARIKRGLSSAGSNIVDFLKDLLVGLIVAIPYLILIAVLVGIPVLIIVLIVRHSRKKKAKKYAGQTYTAYVQTQTQAQAAPSEPSAGQSDVSAGNTESSVTAEAGADAENIANTENSADE